MLTLLALPHFSFYSPSTKTRRIRSSKVSSGLCFPSMRVSLCVHEKGSHPGCILPHDLYLRKENPDHSNCNWISVYKRGWLTFVSPIRVWHRCYDTITNLSLGVCVLAVGGDAICLVGAKVSCLGLEVCDEADTCRFVLTSRGTNGSGVRFTLQAPTPDICRAWVLDVSQILETQRNFLNGDDQPPATRL